MDNSIAQGGMQYGQVSEPVQKGNNLAEIEKLEKKKRRLKHLGMGSALYAVFYTFCLFRNASGITYPFFVGATLLYFGYYTGEYTESCAKEHSLWGKATWYRRFLVASALILGALNCMTDSWVLLFFNKALLYTILGVLLLQTWHDVSGWSIAVHLKGLFFLGIGTISRIFTPWNDRGALKKLRLLRNEPKPGINEDKKRMILCVAIGLVISIPLICILLLLLGSADIVFYNMIHDMLTFQIDIKFADFIWNSISVTFHILMMFVLSYGAFCYCNDQGSVKNIDDMASKKDKGFDTYIAVTVSIPVCAIYLLFSGIQIFGLFMGQLKLPEGYTYAEYARSGFFQLVFVCLINIVLVLCILAYFEMGKVLKTVLCVICGCTYIIEASSLFRLSMYIAMYHLTFTRVFALWGLLVIAIVMVGVTCCIFYPKFQLFRYMLVTVSACWILFSAVHPDYWIAKYNIAMKETHNNVDTYYIKEHLSLDAAPALVEADMNFIEEYGEMNGNYKKWVIRDYQEDTQGLFGFRHFNFSRAYASAKNIDSIKSNEAVEMNR